MNRPLRLALVSFYPADASRMTGGIRAVARLLVQGLQRRGGIEIHVIHCHSDIAADRTEAGERLTVHYLAMPRQRVTPNMVSRVGRIVAQLRAIQPDVVNADNANYAVAALRAGYNPVWTIHGVLREEVRFNPGLFNKLAFALEGYYERQALGKVAHITAISPYIQHTYQWHTAATWHLTENPAPDDLFTLERRPVAGRLLLPAAVIRARTRSPCSARWRRRARSCRTSTCKSRAAPTRPRT